MYINKKNIDFNISQKVGKDVEGRTIRMRIDKLTLVSNVESHHENNLIYEKLDYLSSRKYKKYRIQSIRGINGKPYRKAIIIRKKIKPSPLILRIDYFPINHKTGSIRLEFHPQHLTPKNIDHLVCWLNKKLDNKLNALLLESWITQIDTAVDIYGAQLEDYIFGLKNSETAKYFDKKYGLPGLRLGSIRSQLHIHCYEKIDGYRNEIISSMKRTSLMNIHPNDCDKFLRIESRFRPKKNISSQDNRILLKNILQIDNPFTRLSVFDRKIALILYKKGFIRSYPCNPSLIELKSCIKSTEKISRLTQKHLHLVSKSEISLFDINMVWKSWPKCVSRLGNAFEKIIKNLHHEKNQSLIR
ncbi:hypothetical protein [Lelliottia amnigena]|uniref:hypothetical protein n=1 Tax=Lelliottia amnigena TaxID=61646 RepID=UPI00405669CA